MSHGYASRQRGGTFPTMLAGKVALASAALAAAASFARLAVPRLVAVGAAFFPRLCAVARFSLAPPYLFVIVHLIILVIWKLSDHKHSQQAQAQHRDPWPADHPAPHPAPEAAPAPSAEVAAPAPSAEVAAPAPSAEAAAPVVRDKEDFYAGGRYAARLEPEASPDSGGGESCVTTESDEDASSPPSSNLFEARRSVAPRGHERAVLEPELSLPPQTVDCDADEDDHDLDATWKAIMRKTRPAPAPAAAAQAPAPPAPAQPSPRPPPPRARDPSLRAEEMNRRFDDFIKKNRHSFGRQ